MLDVDRLDKALKLKIFGRMSATMHPFLKLIKNSVEVSFFKPRTNVAVDPTIGAAIKLLRSNREGLWELEELDNNVMFLKAIRSTPIVEFLNERGLRSIVYYLIRGRNKRLMGDLTGEELGLLINYTELNKRDKLLRAVNINLAYGNLDNVWDTIYSGHKFRKISECTSKSVRETMFGSATIKNFKIGLNLDEKASKSWFLKVSQLKSVIHRSTILRVAHGDVYTQEKLARFGLSDEVGCPRCDLVEDLEHKIFRCDYVNRIWDVVLRVTNGPIDQDRLKSIMGVDSKFLNIHAEVLKRILSIKKEAEYLVHPKTFVKLALKTLIVHELDNAEKITLEKILEKV
jgi:hypothetical protein